MNDLNEKIIQWASDKGILAKGTPEGQIAKTLEELIETAQAVALYDNAKKRNSLVMPKFLSEVKDGIGDVYVTLVIHAKMNGFENVRIASIDELPNKQAFEQLGKHIIDLIRYRHHVIYANAFACLDQLAMSHGLTLRECVEHSYQIIASRTGKMQDGVFVKDN